MSKFILFFLRKNKMHTWTVRGSMEDRLKSYTLISQVENVQDRQSSSHILPIPLFWERYVLTWKTKRFLDLSSCTEVVAGQISQYTQTGFK